MLRKLYLGSVLKGVTCVRSYYPHTQLVRVRFPEVCNPTCRVGDFRMIYRNVDDCKSCGYSLKLSKERYVALLKSGKLVLKEA